MVLDQTMERAAPLPPNAPPSWLGGEPSQRPPRACAFCGEVPPPNSSFCPHCGRALTAALAPRRGEALSVVFTDIEDSTQLTEHLGDTAWEAILDEHNDIVREELERHAGFEVKLTGDGFLMVFADAWQALQCAVRIQAQVTLRAQARGASWPVRVRVGVHRGDVILRPGGDILGQTVNMAARIVDKSTGGAILASNAFVEELDGKTPEQFWIDEGERRMKGLRRRERLFRFDWPDFVRYQASLDDPGPDAMRFDGAASFDPFDPVFEKVGAGVVVGYFDGFIDLPGFDRLPMLPMLPMLSPLTGLNDPPSLSEVVQRLASHVSVDWSDLRRVAAVTALAALFDSLRRC